MIFSFALVQSMTDSCSYFSMWRVFDTLSSRDFAIPTLRSRWSLSMGLLRFSLFEAAKNQSFIKLEPKLKGWAELWACDEVKGKN